MIKPASTTMAFFAEIIRRLSVVLALAMTLVSASAAEPGTVLGIEGDALRVQTGSGHLLRAAVQAPGRKQVSGREFANGRDVIGQRLGAAAAD